jgi:hypothetical protein
MVEHQLIPEVSVRSDDRLAVALARPFGRSESVSQPQDHIGAAGQLQGS